MAAGHILLLRLLLRQWTYFSCEPERLKRQKASRKSLYLESLAFHRPGLLLSYYGQEDAIVSVSLQFPFVLFSFQSGSNNFTHSSIMGLTHHYLMGLGPNIKKILHEITKQVRIPEGM